MNSSEYLYLLLLGVYLVDLLGCCMYLLSFSRWAQAVLQSAGFCLPFLLAVYLLLCIHPNTWNCG